MVPSMELKERQTRFSRPCFYLTLRKFTQSRPYTLLYRGIPKLLENNFSKNWKYRKNDFSKNANFKKNPKLRITLRSPGITLRSPQDKAVRSRVTKGQNLSSLEGIHQLCAMHIALGGSWAMGKSAFPQKLKNQNTQAKAKRIGDRFGFSACSRS